MFEPGSPSSRGVHCLMKNYQAADFISAISSVQSGDAKTSVPRLTFISQFFVIFADCSSEAEPSITSCDDINDSLC